MKGNLKKKAIILLGEALIFALMCVILLMSASFIVRSLTEWETISESYGSTEKSISMDTASEEAQDILQVVSLNLARYGLTEKPKLHIANQTKYGVSVTELLNQALPCGSIFSEQPTVLIYHTHGTEGYVKGTTYTKEDDFRSVDTKQNIVAVGDAMKKRLNQLGIGVIHDTEMYDRDDYSKSYALSRRAVEENLRLYPSIKYVIDLHRDSVESNGVYAKACTLIEGRSTAQVMLVVGTDESGSNHDHWEKNLISALHLQNKMNELYPTLARPVYLRTASFNQDMSIGCMLIEIGTSGNTLEEAIRAAEYTADAMAEAFG